MKRLLDHSVEHLYVRAGRWYTDVTLTPPGSLRVRAVWRIIERTAHYDAYYATHARSNKRDHKGENV